MVRVAELRVDGDRALQLGDPRAQVAAAHPVHAGELRMRARVFRISAMAVP